MRNLRLHLIKYLSLASIIWVSSAFKATAQMVKGEICDSSLSKKAYIIYNPKKGGDQFDGVEDRLQIDDKGRFSYDARRLGDRTFCPAYLILGDGSEWQFMLKPSSTLQVKVEKKKGDTEVTFSGKDAEASNFMKHYGKLYDYQVFFPYEGEKRVLAGQDSIKVLEDGYQTLAKEVKKVKDVEMRSFLAQLNEGARINFLTRLIAKKDPRQKDLLAQIDINNWIGLYNYLPQCVVRASMDPKLDECFGKDMTDFGLAYMQVIKEKVTDPTVLHALLDDCGEYTLLYGKDIADVDKFWKSYCEMAGGDSTLIKKYQDKVVAIKAIKKGKEAPDFTFSDRDGKSYHLKDFRGKVLYIDCWATWCGPCCKEIPFLEKRVEEYKDNDKVRFISISMDSNKQAWMNKLDKDKPQWEQFIVSKEEHKALSKAYGISGIPRFLVINANGTIANGDAFRPSDEKFHEQLDEIINGN